MSPTDVAESYIEAWNAHDHERVAGHFAEDGVRHWQVIPPPLIGGPTRFEGPAEIAAGVKTFMDAVPDMTVDVETLVETDWGVMLEWRIRGTHTGAWDEWTGQGEDVDFAGISFARVADGKIVEEQIYFDPDMMARNWAPPLGGLMSVGVKMWHQSRATKKARAA